MRRAPNGRFGNRRSKPAVHGPNARQKSVVALPEQTSRAVLLWLGLRYTRGPPFLGGWLPPFPNTPALHFLYSVPSWMWFFLKSFAFLYLFIWIRATLPRYRYDQLMRLGWKVLIPVAIANLVLTGIVKVLLAWYWRV